MPELEGPPTEGCRVGEADRLCLIPAISEQAFRDIPEDMSEVGAMRGLKTATVEPLDLTALVDGVEEFPSSFVYGA